MNWPADQTHEQSGAYQVCRVMTLAGWRYQASKGLRTKGTHEWSGMLHSTPEEARAEARRHAGRP